MESVGFLKNLLIVLAGMHGVFKGAASGERGEATISVPPHTEMACECQVKKIRGLSFFL